MAENFTLDAANLRRNVTPLTDRLKKPDYTKDMAKGIEDLTREVTGLSQNTNQGMQDSIDAIKSTLLVLNNSIKNPRPMDVQLNSNAANWEFNIARDSSGLIKKIHATKV